MTQQDPTGSGRRDVAVHDGRPARGGLFRSLQSLFDGAGNSVGNAYARAAAAILRGKESLEDARAERRAVLRAKARRVQPAAGQALGDHRRSPSSRG